MGANNPDGDQLQAEIKRVVLRKINKKVSEANILVLSVN